MLPGFHQYEFLKTSFFTAACHRRRSVDDEIMEKAPAHDTPVNDTTGDAAEYLTKSSADRQPLLHW